MDGGELKMTLTNKARGLHKQAILGGLALSHIGQNLIGKPIASSKWFSKDVGRSAIMGAVGKQSPRNVGTYAKDAAMGVAAPEVNAAKNMAYTEGRAKAKELHNSIRKTPEYKKARKDSKAKGKDLKLDRATLKELAVKRKEFMESTGTSKKDFKDIQKLPKGNRLPSSTKAAVGANAALALVPGGASTAAVNAAKLGAGTKAYSKSKLGKYLNDKLISKPMAKAHKTGTSGGTFNRVRNEIESLSMNPFTAHAEKLSYKAGKHKTSVKEDLVSRARNEFNKRTKK